MEQGETKAAARTVPEAFALPSGSVGGTMELAASGPSASVTDREGRWSSDAFVVYAGLTWMTQVRYQAQVDGVGEQGRQPG